MLIAAVGIEAGPLARVHDRLQQRHVARRAAVHFHERAAADARRGRPLLEANDAGRSRRVEQEPCRRDVQRGRDREQGVQRWSCLLVLDLREVADVQAGPLADLGKREIPRSTPAPDLGSNRRPADRRNPVFCIGQCT